MSETINSDSEIATPSKSSIICDGQIVSNIIDDFGVEIVIREVSSSSSSQDAYDDQTESYSDHRTKGVINTYTESDDEVKEGIFKKGQVAIFLKVSDSEYAIPGNRIWVNSKWWEIASVDENWSGTYNFPVQCTLNRI
jgi:hypothetical protein